MDDDPMKIAKAIRISRKCLRIVYENIAFALGIKGLCLILGCLLYTSRALLERRNKDEKDLQD